MEVKFFDEKVEAFIKGFEKPTVIRILRAIELLKNFGFQLGMPHSKKVAGKLFELRIRGRQEIRLFYVFNDDAALVLHGLVKKSYKIPQHELENALQKMRVLAKK